MAAARNAQNNINSHNLPNKSVFIYNLASSVTDYILYELFLQAGPIDECLITSRHRDRAGHVTYKHADSVDYAQDLFKGTCLFGKELSMSSIDILSERYTESEEALRGRGHRMNGDGQRHMVPSRHHRRYEPYERPHDRYRDDHRRNDRDRDRYDHRHDYHHRRDDRHRQRR